MAKRTAKSSLDISVQVFQPLDLSFVEACKAICLNIVVDGRSYNVSKGDTPGSLRIITSTHGTLAVRPMACNSVELAIT